MARCSDSKAEDSKAEESRSEDARRWRVNLDLLCFKIIKTSQHIPSAIRK